ncbi:MAG: hypothetical protein R3F54_22675 [Alphaproteobacteria bacterium]
MIERRGRTRQGQARRLAAAPASLAAAILLSAIGHQALADQRCSKGTDVRLIEIRFANAAGALPCKVIYRPETESDTLGIVSWQNLASEAACAARAREVTDRLSEEGWTCSDEVAAASERRTILATTAEKPVDGVTGGEPVVTPPAASPTAEAPHAVLPAEADANADAAAAEVPDRPARLLDNPDLPAPPAPLAALVREDLGELDTTLDGQLEAEIGAYGDLNDDAIDDALVVFTYRSAQPAYRQFLAVYMFDGSAYQLTATRPVGGTGSGTMDARIEGIDRGVVHLSMRAFEPGDASCCPSGTRRIALALRDLDLVEIDRNSPTR